MSGRHDYTAKRNLTLDKAAERFLEIEYEATSLEAIASRGDVSKVTLYKQFGTKRGPYRAAMMRWLSNLQFEINVSRTDQLQTC